MVLINGGNTFTLIEPSPAHLPLQAHLIRQMCSATLEDMPPFCRSTVYFSISTFFISLMIKGLPLPYLRLKEDK